MIDPVSADNFLTNVTAPSSVSSVTASATSASTPFVLPEPYARVFISEIFPLMTSNLTSRISPTAVSVLSLLAPAPTGSRSTTCPSSFALFPARYIDGIVFLLSVPILIFSPPHMLVISGASSSSSDMIGLPPQARITFATSFTVT